MGFLSTVGTGVLIVALLTSTFVRFAMLEVSNYRIDTPNIWGKVIVVTGANSGLGYHTSEFLAKKGAFVVMACRSKSRCEDAKAKILTNLPTATIDTLVLDLSSFQSVKDFVANFSAKYSTLDVLVNNAGIMAVPTRELTKDGIESQIGTNHFGHFLLTGLLLPLIAKGGRIVNHSSSAHYFAKSNFVFQDLQSEQNYDPWTAYGNSKAANLLFTYELNRRLAESSDERGIISVAVHPGYTNTNLQTGTFPFHEYANAFVAMKGEHGALAQNEGVFRYIVFCR